MMGGGSLNISKIFVLPTSFMDGLLMQEALSFLPKLCDTKSGEIARRSGQQRKASDARKDERKSPL